jgi:hypothetical protein
MRRSIVCGVDGSPDSLGSVSYSLVGIAGCPVLIVPPGPSEER